MIDSSWALDLDNGFFDGLIAFQDQQGKWGYMNTQGEVVILPRFDDRPTTFSDGVYIRQVQGHAAGNKDGYLVLTATMGKLQAKIPLCSKAGSIYDIQDWPIMKAYSR